MTTAVLSDLHTGTATAADLIRVPEARSRLREALEDADRVVFLGDLLELRSQPVEATLEVAREALPHLAPALAGKEVVVVAGNHDHKIVEPYLERLRFEGGSLGVDWSVEPDGGDLAGELARLWPDAKLKLAYPGVRIREDVFAMHGHYLDVHMTVPRVECMLASVMDKVSGGRHTGHASPADYERPLSPIYALSYAMAQGAGVEAAQREHNLSRNIWGAANRNGGGRLMPFMVGKVAIPGGVAALNLAGLGPFRSDVSGRELLRSGLEAIGRVVTNLGIEAEHVLFGHTHRAGPLEGEDGEWRTPSGVRLWNAGSWYREPMLLEGSNPDGPYRPGRLLMVDETGPPRHVDVLKDLPALRQ